MSKTHPDELSHLHLRWILPLALWAALAACTATPGKDGASGTNGTSCSVTNNHDGTATIRCTDGTSATVANGDAGVNGTNGTNGTNATNGNVCTVHDNGNGTATITCTDGTSATVSNGTNGTNGASCVVTINADSTKTITCADGSSVTVADAVVDYSVLTADERRQGLFSAVITGITIPADGRPVVTLKVSERHGYGVKNLSTLAVSWRFAMLKLVPGSGSGTGDPGVNGSFADTWVSYMASNSTSTSSTETAVAAGLTDNHDGTYTYRFTKVLTGGIAAAGTTYEPTRTHRLVVLLSASSNPFSPIDLVKDFIPSTGADTTGLNEKVDPAACLECHTTFRAIPGGTGSLATGEFHSGGRYDVRTCIACHNDQRRFTTPSVNTAFDANISAAGTWTGSLVVVNGEAVLDLPVFIHKIHQGGKLALQGGNYAGVPAPYQTTYPQDVRNCAKCHRAPAVLASRWQKLSRRACGSCHDAVSFASPVPQGRVAHTGGAAADDTQCSGCHVAGGIAKDAITAHQPVAPPDPNNIYLNPTSGSSNTNAAFIAAEGFVPAGAQVVTSVIKAVQAFDDGLALRPRITFKLQVADPTATPPLPATDVVFPVPGPGVTELIAGFVGSPSVYFVWAQPQDGITSPADFNASANGYLRSLWNGSATGTLSGPDASGFYTVTLTGTAIPPNATMLTGGIGYTYSLGTAPTFSNNTQPLTQVNLPAYGYVANASGFAGKGGLIVPAADHWAVAASYSGRRAIVENARCNACHVSLGVTPTYHAGQRNDATSCAFCHRPNQTSGAWSANAKDAIHAIHASGKRTVPFTWHAPTPTSGYYQVTYPAVLNACVACHLPGTFDFSGPAAIRAQPNLLPTTVGTGRYNASPLSNPAGYFTISPYVTADNLVDHGFGYASANVTAVQPNGLSGTQGVTTCSPAAPCVCTVSNPCSVVVNVSPVIVSGVSTSFTQKIGSVTTLCSAATPCTCTTAQTCAATLATCTPAAPCEAQGTTLIVSPIVAACAACHDSALAIDHMQTNAGSFYEPRSVASARPQKEECLLCHGPGRLASIADRHTVLLP